MARTRGWHAVVGMALVVAGCGSGGAGVADRTETGGDALATLAVIDTDVDVNDASGEAGQDLVVGDLVATNPAGFGEINYFDGSLTRVSRGAEFTLTDLSDDQGERRVATSLDAGTSWNRVEELSQSDDGYSVDTPVATATATGTAFVVDCERLPTSCTFAVVEGTIDIDLPDGTTIELTAPETLTVIADEPLATPEALTDEQIAADGWITRNAGLDEAKGFDPIDTIRSEPADNDAVSESSMDLCGLFTTDEINAWAVDAATPSWAVVSTSDGMDASPGEGQGRCEWTVTSEPVPGVVVNPPDCAAAPEQCNTPFRLTVVSADLAGPFTGEPPPNPGTVDVTIPGFDGRVDVFGASGSAQSTDGTSYSVSLSAVGSVCDGTEVCGRPDIVTEVLTELIDRERANR